MRVQLLHPPTHVAPGNLQAARPAQSLGLAYVAGALRAAGHEVSLLDAVAGAPARRTPAPPLVRIGLTDDEVLSRIDPAAPVLGIGNMFSFNWPALRGLIRRVRERFPGKVIVCGGEHFSALPELSMRDAPIDYVVTGEGEETAVALLSRLDAAGGGADVSDLRGVCFRRGAEIVRNPRAERTRAVDELPLPAWDLFDLDAYNDHGLIGGLRQGRTIPILATRGCPYQCTYCSSVGMWTTRWVARDPRRVADEVELYATRYGARSFPFQDLTMIVKRDWIVAFCRELIARRLDVLWQLPTGTRCEVIDDEVAELLHRSGCRWLGFAPESGSERTRELVKKRMKAESLEQAVQASVRAGLHVEAFLVLGFPHDTREDLRETARLARRLGVMGVEDVAVNFFFPIPATELFDDLAARGRLDPRDDVLAIPAFGHSGVLREAWRFCDAMSARELTLRKLWIVAGFYLASWATHPLRPLRVLGNALRGRHTSALEQFLSDRLRRLLGRPARQAVAS